jgi:hypothetical protein
MIIDVLAWVFERAQQDFALFGGPVEEWLAFGDTDSFASAHGTLAVLGFRTDDT